MALRSYIVKRLVYAIPLVFAMIIVNFTLVQVAPGDPVAMLVGEEGLANEDLVRSIRERFGLDKPLHEQLYLYVIGVLQGDLGYSMVYNAKVLDIILARLQASAILWVSAIFIATAIGVALGVFASRKPYSIEDNIMMTGAVVGFSMPVFWLGQLLILGFALYLNLLPAGGIKSFTANVNPVQDTLIHLILPATTLAISHMAVIARLTRGKMLDTIGQDYVITARAKGLDERTILFKHVLRNALLPVTTIIGYRFVWILMGTVLVEIVFGWPGTGKLMFDSLARRDYPLLMGTFLILSLFVIIVNLVVDILYAFIDPRVKYE